MRVLHVIAEMGVGGAEAVVAALADDALERGDVVTIASNGGWRADALAARGARVVPIPLAGRDPRALLAGVRAVRRELRTARPELVHVHNVKAALVVRLAGLARPRPPVVVTLHGVPDADYTPSARILRRSADVVVAVSSGVRDRLIDAGFPGARVRVIENAVRPHVLPDRAVARAELALPALAPVAVCLARLAPPKRHDLLVAAWAAAPADALLLLAGDGPHRPAIEAAAAAAGLADRVRLLGAREDVGTLLAAADLCVLASDSEGLPISVLEAMAAGVPTVVSAVGGLPDALPGAACLVEPGSAAALADGIRTVLADAALRDRLVAAGSALVAERYGLAPMLAAYRALYAELLRR